MSKEALEFYVSQNLNFTTADMGKYFNISSPGAWYWLRKFGFSYKKSLTYLEVKQEQRDAYQEVIKDIPPHSLVYIDESGMEMSICADRD